MNVDNLKKVWIDVDEHETSKILSSVGIKGWKESVQVPYGVCISDFIIQKAILDGAKYDKDKLPDTVDVMERGSIPTCVSKEARKVPLSALLGKKPPKRFAETIITYRMKLGKKQDPSIAFHGISSLISSTELIFRGENSYNHVTENLFYPSAPSTANINEMSRGIYTSDSFECAVTYAKPCGVVYVYNKDVLNGRLTSLVFSGDRWKAFVKACICIQIPDKMPPEDTLGIDILIGPISSNYDAVRTCQDPQESSITQFVFISPNAITSLHSQLVAIVYLE